MTDLNPQTKAWPQCSECKTAYVLRRATLFKTSGQTMEVGDQWTDFDRDLCERLIREARDDDNAMIRSPASTLTDCYPQVTAT